MAELLFFPFFTNLTIYHADTPESDGLNSHDPRLVVANKSFEAALVSRAGQTALVYGGKSYCNKQCVHSWPEFVHFRVDENGAICDGPDSHICDCDAALCLGDTIVLGRRASPHGVMKIPYNAPSRIELSRKANGLNGTVLRVAEDDVGFNYKSQQKWLMVCNDRFSEAARNVSCTQLGLTLHQYASQQMQIAGLDAIEDDYENLYFPGNFTCRGSERNLSSCKIDINSEAQVPIRCSFGPVRMYCADWKKMLFDDDKVLDVIAKDTSQSISDNPLWRDLPLLAFRHSLGTWTTICRRGWTPALNRLACEWSDRTDPFDNGQAQSCFEHRINYMLLDRPAYNGIYFIYSKQLGDIIPVYCDMTIDDGGWTLVLSVDFPENPQGWTRKGSHKRNLYSPSAEGNYSSLVIADSLQVVSSSHKENLPEILIRLNTSMNEQYTLHRSYSPEFSLVSTTPAHGKQAAYLESEWGYKVFDMDENLTWAPVPWFHEDRDGRLVYTFERNFSVNSEKESGTLFSTGSRSGYFSKVDKNSHIQMYVRSKNYQIKDPLEVDCTNMDYLLGGNKKLAHPHFASSSIYSGNARDFEAHGSYLGTNRETGENSGWIASREGKADGSEWIGVDLLMPHKIVALLIRGVEDENINRESHTSGAWVSSFILRVSEAVDRGHYAGEGKNYQGNRNAHSIRTVHFPPEAEFKKVRFLRIYPTGGPDNFTENLRFGLRWEIIGCSRSPGSKTGYILKDLSPDPQTDQVKDYRLGAPFSKMWSSSDCSQEQIEIRLPQAYRIRSIVIAGNPNMRSDVVKKFALLFSKSGATHDFQWYGASMDGPDSVDNDEPRIFSGPRDGTVLRHIEFRFPWSARLLRFVFLEPTAKCYLRLELTGEVVKDGCTLPLGMRSGEIADYQLTSSSQHTRCKGHERRPKICMTSYGPERARYAMPTDSVDARGVRAWMPAPEDENPWIAVDLKRMVQISAIVFQALNRSFVASFRLQYSMHSIDWMIYAENQTLRVDETYRIGQALPAFVVYLTPAIYARHIKIHPLSFERFGSGILQRYVKFELLGCEIIYKYHPERPQFTVLERRVLSPDPHFDSFWRNLTDIECADRCLDEEGFTCLGYYSLPADKEVLPEFRDRRDQNLCILSSANQKSFDVAGFTLNTSGIIYNHLHRRCVGNIGITNPKLISDDRFSASSNPDQASSARLLIQEDGFYQQGWMGSVKDNHDNREFIQVDLKVKHLITGVHLNGVKSGKTYLKSFLIGTTLNGLDWTICCEGVWHMLFNATGDGKVQTTWIKASMQPVATQVRIYPHKYECKERTMAQKTCDDVAAFQFEFAGCALIPEEDHPMGYAELRCDGSEESPERCRTAVPPTAADVHCNAETIVRPRCLQYCGDPGYISCSKRQGVRFYAPNKVTYICANSSVREITCQSNGFWSSFGGSCVQSILTNVAVREYTNQSSTSTIPNIQDSSRAVDGSKEGVLSTCSFTNEEMYPWWYVDLGQQYEIFDINITFGFGSRDAELRVGMENPYHEDGTIYFEDNPICRSNGLKGEAVQNYECGTVISSYENASKDRGRFPTFGQYLSIQIVESLPASLSICEVTVWGKPCALDDMDDVAEFSMVYRSSNDTEDIIMIDVEVFDVNSQHDQRLGCQRVKDEEYQPFLVFVPPGAVNMGKITITADPNWEYPLGNFQVLVGDHSARKYHHLNFECDHHRETVPPGTTVTMKCRQPVSGSYVIIKTRNSNARISVCDVKIWAKLCKSQYDMVFMRPLAFPSTKSSLNSDVAVVSVDDKACFETGSADEYGAYVALDMITPAEITTVKFTLCETMVSGEITIRLGNEMPVKDAEPTNGILASDIQITAFLSKNEYTVSATKYPPLSGRFLSVHMTKKQTLCLCEMKVIQERACSKPDSYHNAAYGRIPEVSSHDLAYRGPEVVTDGERGYLRHLCFASARESRPFLVLHFKVTKDIYVVRIVTKHDSVKEVRVGNDPINFKNNKKCGTTSHPTSGEPRPIKAVVMFCSFQGDEKGVPLTGTTLSIEVVEQDTTQLVLCEVEAWGVTRTAAID